MKHNLLIKLILKTPLRWMLSAKTRGEPPKDIDDWSYTRGNSTKWEDTEVCLSCNSKISFGEARGKICNYCGSRDCTNFGMHRYIWDGKNWVGQTKKHR